MKTIILLLFAISSTICVSAIDLVVNSKPASVIVIAENAPDPVREAAEDMRRYLYKISGAKFEIVSDSQKIKSTKILIGESKYTRQYGYTNSDFKSQEYMMKTIGKDLILMGRDESDSAVKKINGYSWCEKKYFQQIGSLYAVNSFLEKYCGVRWYMPTPIGEVIPRENTISIPAINLRRCPSTLFRVMFAYRSISAKLWVWKYKDIIKPAPPLLPEEELMKWGRRLKMGGIPFYGNHGQIDYYKRFGKLHPEWFANKTPQRGNQLCYSNNEVFEQVVKDARDFFDGKYHKYGCGKSFCVMPDDTSIWCTCDKCLSQYDKRQKNKAFHNGYTSEYVWKFVSRVANEIKKTHPKAVIACAAYWDYCEIPKVDIPDNVTVVICGTRSADWNAKEKEKRRKFIKDWRKKTSNIVVWDYYLFPENKTYDRFPMVAPHNIAEFIAFLKKQQLCKGMMMQMDEYYEKNLVLDHLRIYVSLKLLDDWNVNVNDILEEYYSLFYGPAAEPMKQFWTRIENIYFQTRNEKSEYTGAEYDWMELCPSSEVEQLGRIMEMAKEKTEPKSIYRKRVELIDEAVYKAVIVGNSRYVRKIMKTTKVLACPYISQAPEIDGKLSEKSWEQAAEATGWTGISGGKAPVYTKVKIMYDDNNIYVAYICHDRKDYTLQAKYQTKDVNLICKDDSVELFIVPGNNKTGNKRFQIICNSVPVIYDAADNNTAWDSQARVVVNAYPGIWCVEMAVPLKALGIKKIKPGDTWRINFCRNRYGLPGFVRPFMNWSGPDGYSKTNRYGIIKFK